MPLTPLITESWTTDRTSAAPGSFAVVTTGAVYANRVRPGIGQGCVRRPTPAEIVAGVTLFDGYYTSGVGGVGTLQSHSIFLWFRPYRDSYVSGVSQPFIYFHDQDHSGQQVIGIDSIIDAAGSVSLINQISTSPASPATVALGPADQWYGIHIGMLVTSGGVHGTLYNNRAYVFDLNGNGTQLWDSYFDYFNSSNIRLELSFPGNTNRMPVAGSLGKLVVSSLSSLADIAGIPSTATTPPDNPLRFYFNPTGSSGNTGLTSGSPWNFGEFANRMARGEIWGYRHPGRVVTSGSPTGIPWHADFFTTEEDQKRWAESYDAGLVDFAGDTCQFDRGTYAIAPVEQIDTTPVPGLRIVAVDSEGDVIFDADKLLEAGTWTTTAQPNVYRRTDITAAGIAVWQDTDRKALLPIFAASASAALSILQANVGSYYADGTNGLYVHALGDVNLATTPTTFYRSQIRTAPAGNFFAVVSLCNASVSGISFNGGAVWVQTDTGSSDRAGAQYLVSPISTNRPMIAVDKNCSYSRFGKHPYASSWNSSPGQWGLLLRIESMTSLGPVGYAGSGGISQGDWTCGVNYLGGTGPGNVGVIWKRCQTVNGVSVVGQAAGADSLGYQSIFAHSADVSQFLFRRYEDCTFRGIAGLGSTDAQRVETAGIHVYQETQSASPIQQHSQSWFGKGLFFFDAAVSAEVTDSIIVFAAQVNTSTRSEFSGSADFVNCTFDLRLATADVAARGLFHQVTAASRFHAESCLVLMPSAAPASVSLCDGWTTGSDFLAVAGGKTTSAVLFPDAPAGSELNVVSAADFGLDSNYVPATGSAAISAGLPRVNATDFTGATFALRTTAGAVEYVSPTPPVPPVPPIPPVPPPPPPQLTFPGGMKAGLFIGSDVNPIMQGVNLAATGVPYDSALIEWNLMLGDESVSYGMGTLDYITDSNGDYRGTIPASLTATLIKGVGYVIVFTIKPNGATIADIRRRYYQAQYRGRD